MKRFIILMMVTTVMMGCARQITPILQSSKTPKINARILVYMPEDFINYHYSYDAVAKRYDYYFKALTVIEFPQMISGTFVKADFSYKSKELTDNYDFLLVPEFISAHLFTDKVMGNDLLIYIKATFTSKNNAKEFVIEGTGKASDDGITAKTEDLGSIAFSNALKDLKLNILAKRNLFETGTR